MPGITFLNFQHLSTSASKTEAAIPFSSAEHSLVLCLCIPGSKEAKYCPQSTARCSHECGFSGSGIARRLGTTPPREPGRSFPLKGDDGRQVTRAEGKKNNHFYSQNWQHRIHFPLSRTSPFLPHRLSPNLSLACLVVSQFAEGPALAYQGIERLIPASDGSFSLPLSISVKRFSPPPASSPFRDDRLFPPSSYGASKPPCGEKKPNQTRD